MRTLFSCHLPKTEAKLRKKTTCTVDNAEALIDHAQHMFTQRAELMHYFQLDSNSICNTFML